MVSRDRASYRHQSQYTVRYDDLDTYRHVNNKSFLTFVEDARVRYLRDVMAFRHHEDAGTGVMVVHSSIDYLGQIMPFETVTVWTRCARIGRSSVELHHLVEAHGDNAEAASPASASGAAGAGVGAAAGSPEPLNGAHGEQRLCATSVTVLASVDMQKNTSTPTDASVVEAITAWEPVAPARGSSRS
jgi:acyl-CoA thioester hydrolase